MQNLGTHVGTYHELLIFSLLPGVGRERIADVHGKHAPVQRLQLPSLLLGNSVLARRLGWHTKSV